MEIGLPAIRRAVALVQPRVISAPSLAQAAVLLPFLESGPDLTLLFTRRTDTVRHHKGQVSFPGGAQHAHESLESTALRETEEEIGIRPPDVEILGRFHEYLSSSEYRVTTFIAVVSGHSEIVPNPAEVAYLLRVPLRFFLETQPECRTMERRGQKMAVYFYNYGKDVIWGLTARIVKEFVDLLVASETNKRQEPGEF